MSRFLGNCSSAVLTLLGYFWDWIVEHRRYFGITAHGYWQTSSNLNAGS